MFNHVYPKQVSVQFMDSVVTVTSPEVPESVPEAMCFDPTHLHRLGATFQKVWIL